MSGSRELIEELRVLRDKIVRIRANNDLFDRAQALKDAIDGMAEGLTGQRDYFWAKPHSLAQGPK